MADLLNCYSVVIDKNGITRRRGIPCGEMKDNRVLINGLGRQQIFICPVSIEDGWSDDELRNAFAHYEGKYPWLGQESDGRMYLYSMGILRDSLYLKPYDQEKHVDYVYIEAPGDQNLRLLGFENTVLFRWFDGEKQYAMFALRGWAVIRYQNLMLETFGDGQFSCC